MSSAPEIVTRAEQPYVAISCAPRSGRASRSSAGGTRDVLCPHATGVSAAAAITSATVAARGERRQDAVVVPCLAGRLERTDDLGETVGGKPRINPPAGGA